MSEAFIKKWKPRVPFLTVTTLILISTYFLLWGWAKVVSFIISHYSDVEVFILPVLFGRAERVHMLIIPTVLIISVFGWLLSTRVKEYTTPRMRVITFFNMILTNCGILVGYGMTIIRENVLPFFYQRLDRVIETSDAVNQALFEQVNGFFFMLVLLPFLLVMFICIFLVTRYRKHDDDLRVAFLNFKWTGERLRKFENMSKIDDSITSLPHIELGINKETKEMVVLPGKDRTLNTIITGSIGTGKTKALAEPIIKQDLDYLTQFLNDFPVIRKLENYQSEEIQGRYMNGISIIEPSNDLCRSVYKLAKAHGIPEEAITYIDPTNPNTPCLNVMQGPTEKVAEVFAEVIAGLSTDKSGGSFFFQQAQRNHLKYHIYLLKMHDPRKEVTFDMLLDMYNDTNRVHDMHVELKKRFPKGYDQIEDRDEYNYWQILKGVDEWFDNVITEKTERSGPSTIRVRDDHGKPIYIDTQAEYVQGLRNILNDIGANPLIRRVLFGKSKFNFDDHMGSIGGILLVNTAKGELSTLGSVLGKIVLMQLQNASFRREPNVSTYHHIVVDEAPEYLYSSFSSFPAQSRKYKVILTIIQQTLTQLRGAYGEDYMNTVVAAMRNRMVYADISNFDSRYFSEMFGDEISFEESESEQSISPLQENPVTRSGSNYSKVQKAAMSASDIIFQEAFECAVKIVIDNKTIKAQKIKANFLPKKEYEVSRIRVSDHVIKEWIEARNIQEIERLKSDMYSLGDVEGMQVEKDSQLSVAHEASRKENNSYDRNHYSTHDSVNNDNSNEHKPDTIDIGLDNYHLPQMEQALNVPAQTKPREENVNYQPFKSSVLSAVTVPYAHVWEEDKKKNKGDEQPIQQEKVEQIHVEDVPLSFINNREEVQVKQNVKVEKEPTAHYKENKNDTKVESNVQPLPKITIPNKTPSKSNEENLVDLAGEEPSLLKDEQKVQTERKEYIPLFIPGQSKNGSDEHKYFEEEVPSVIDDLYTELKNTAMSVGDSGNQNN